MLNHTGLLSGEDIEGLVGRPASELGPKSLEIRRESLKYTEVVQAKNALAAILSKKKALLAKLEALARARPASIMMTGLDEARHAELAAQRGRRSEEILRDRRWLLLPGGAGEEEDGEDGQSAKKQKR